MRIVGDDISRGSRVVGNALQAATQTKGPNRDDREGHSPNGGIE